jgi:hypothetical protein
VSRIGRDQASDAAIGTVEMPSAAPTGSLTS